MNPNVLAPGMEAMAMAEGASVDQPLAEGNSYSTASSENPLTRNLVVSIKASLNDFCLQKTRGTWAPSQEALRSIFQQRKYAPRRSHSHSHNRVYTLADSLTVAFHPQVHYVGRRGRADGRHAASSSSRSTSLVGDAATSHALRYSVLLRGTARNLKPETRSEPM